MAHADPTNRLLGAGCALAGLLVVMSAPAPSLGPVLIGAVSILLWIGFAVTPVRKVPAARRRVPIEPRPVPSEPGPLAREPDSPAESAKPRRVSAHEAMTLRSGLPKVPTHRQRIRGREL